MVKEIIEKLKNAENRSEELIKEAEADAQGKFLDFQKEKERHLEGISNKNIAIRKKTIDDAEKEAKKEESNILATAQEEMNHIRALSDKKREKAVSLIIEKIFTN